ncbi:MAG: DUF2934 domain-containing protein, partial [Nitrospira sp.]|nr:DUF2934 domain-containing protein [Nitrospira sp.]
FSYYIVWTHFVFLVRPFLAPAFRKLQKHVIDKYEWEGKTLHAKIEKAAYKLYEKSRRIEGRDLNNWLKAERRIKRKHFFYAFIKNVFLRNLDFSATFVSILILLVLRFILKLPICTQAFHFYFIGVIMITTSFEFYIVRFKRYQEVLKALFLNSKETSE